MCCGWPCCSPDGWQFTWSETASLDGARCDHTLWSVRGEAKVITESSAQCSAYPWEAINTVLSSCCSTSARVRVRALTRPALLHSWPCGSSSIEPFADVRVTLCSNAGLLQLCLQCKTLITA